MKIQNETSTLRHTGDDLDVVEQANYGILSEDYNEQFRSWRRDECNEYAFHCRKRENEAVYIEGKGYHSPDPAKEERRAMTRINVILGLAILSYLLIENLLSVALMALARAAGFDVGYYYTGGTVYGNQAIVLGILMLETVLKYLIPLLIMRRAFHMPRRVAFHFKLDAPKEFPVSIAVVLVVFAVTNIWTLFSTVNVLSATTLGTAYYTVSYMSPVCQIIYLLFKLLTASIMTELLLHGEALHVLRQFGDWYAVMVTALLSVCITHSYVTALMELTMALVTGITVLRSGSLLPSICGRILYHMLLFGLFLMEISPNRVLHNYRPLILLGVFLLGVIGCVCLVRPTGRRPLLLPQKHYLSGRERVHTVLHLGPLSIIFCLCLILMVIEVAF